MRRLSSWVAAVVTAGALSGCASVEMSSPGSLAGIEIVGSPTAPDRMVVVRNGGCYVFWMLTLASGDLRWDPVKDDIDGGCAWFKDFGGMDDIFGALQHVARREHRDLANVTMLDASTSDLEVTSYEGAVSGLIGMTSISVSAVLREKEEER